MTSQTTQPQAPRTLTLQLGVILEQHPGVTRWQATVTKPVSVFLADQAMPEDVRELFRDGERIRYLAGKAALVLHRKATDDYISNLRSNPPRVYVGIHKQANAYELAWRPFLVTAAPYEAEGYMHGGDEVVDVVTMPPELIEALEMFVGIHHTDEPFKKRQRTKYFDRHSTPFARPPGWRETDR